MRILLIGFAVIFIVFFCFFRYSHPEPHYIRANGNWFHVYYSNEYPVDLVDDAHRRKVNRVYGLTNCAQHTIEVDPNQSLEELKDVLWHEANHAANDCAGFVEFAKFQDYDDLYPVQVPQQLQLMHDNPTLMDFIR